MPCEPRDTLDTVFTQAIYDIEINDSASPVQLTVGAPLPPALARLLSHASSTRSGWIITAYNPLGQAASDVGNRAGNTVLAQIIHDRAWPVFPACNRDPAGQWPDEPGWLILGAAEEAIRALAGRLGQAAVVCVGPVDVSLVWMVNPSGLNDPGPGSGRSGPGSSA